MSRPYTLRSAVYDSEKRTLTVKFLVGAYLFHNVPHAKGEAMSAEPNREVLMRMFDTMIEGKYKSERIGE